MVTQFLNTVDSIVWGVPLLVLIMGTGLVLTFRLKGMQFVKLGRALRYMVRNEEGAVGEVTSFGALCTALSATIGTGNIVGVSTAVMVGGPGALFWMFIAACIGMATKFSEGCLAVLYRHKNPEGGFLGGPFYYIEEGINERYGWNARWLGKLFALFGCIAGAGGIGTITQINGIATATEGFFKAPTLFTIGADKNITIVTIIVAVVVTVCAALVIIGGIKRIASVSIVIVPFMAIAYVLISLIIIFKNITEVPQAIADIVTMAFGAKAVAGGAFGAFYLAITKGVARGVFSNESGLGSAPIAAAAAQTNQPVRQGLVSMTGTFIDTICVCMMTGLVIMTSGAYEYCQSVPELSEGGAGVTIKAFSMGMLGDAAGSFVIMCALAFFAFTTILGWDYYAERCCEYLFNGSMKAVKVYRWIYVFAVFIGPFLTLSQVWTIADIFNALMAAPNLIGLLLLNGVVAREVKKYFDALETGGYYDGYPTLPLGCHKQ
ncbi:MAG: sodium:alanine symporter family protein [Eubacteriales bacterium]|nr:sodium:alanine symporter family protein [Eubacteriales bacterium]